MGYVLFALVWVINFGISVWNAYAVGKVWVDARHEGGWHRFMCWMGAVLSACGFTWCYLSFLVLSAHYFKWITEEQTMAALDLGYVLLLPFLLFAGYAITLDSWAQAYRRGGFLNYGTAAWNTYASLHNTYSAWQNLGGAFTSLGNYFKGNRSRDDDKKQSGRRGHRGRAAGGVRPDGRRADHRGDHPPRRGDRPAPAAAARGGQTEGIWLNRWAAGQRNPANPATRQRTVTR
jgi:hypothetical protein